MKLKTSFFDPALLKKNLSRFSPAWILTLVGMILFLPVSLMIALQQEIPVVYEITLPRLQRSLREVADAGPFFAIVCALIFAGLLFKYLHKTRAAYMMHAFPMTRTCLYCTNVVSGLLFWLVPTLVTGLLTQIILSANGFSACSGLLWAAMGKWVLQFLCFFGIAVFAMMLSGSTIIGTLCYGAFQGIFALLPTMTLVLVKYYFHGLDISVDVDFGYLAPVFAMLRGCATWLLWLYAGIGLVLLVVAWLHYLRRDIERAGDAMAYRWARIAFRIVFTYSMTLGLGFLLTGILGFVNEERSLVLLPYALIGCVIGWFGSSMMVERTVKVFRKKSVWIGFAICVALLVGTIACLKYDVFGVQRRVPETAQVESVEIWTEGDYNSPYADRITLTDPADINTVRTVHQNAIKAWQKNPDRASDFFRYTVGDIHICYHLAGGGTLRRVYEIPKENYKALARFYADPEIAAAWYERALPENFYRVTLSDVEEYETDEYGNPTYTVSRGRECRDPSALREAVLADARAGRLPIVNCLAESMDLDTGAIRGSYWEHPSLDFENASYSGQEVKNWVSIRILETATETIALFEKE